MPRWWTHINKRVFNPMELRRPVGDAVKRPASIPRISEYLRMDVVEP